MSLQVALKETRERLGKAQTDARELGLAITAAELKGDDAVAKEKQAAFDKVMLDVTKFAAALQRTEMLVEQEKTAATVVNDLPLDPAEAHREGGPAEKGVVSKETAERFAEGIRECQNSYFRFGEQSPEYVAARTKLANQTTSLKPNERQALVGSIGSLGGALVTEDFKAEVIKNMAGFSVSLASGIRVVPCSSNMLVFPSIAGGTDPWSTGYTGSWKPVGSVATDGAAPPQQNQPTFGNERIPVHDWQPDAVVVDPSLLEDSAVPLEAILQEAIAETQAMDWDYAFLRGSGIGQPRGIYDYIGAGVSSVKSGDASLLKYDGLVDLFMTLPAQYREASVWYMKSLTFGAILKLKDSSNNPIIYAGQIPGTLFGKKVWMTEHLPAVAGGAYPILLGNPRYYIVASRRDLRVQRLIERFAPNVAFLPTARVGGALVRPVAFVAQKIEA